MFGAFILLLLFNKNIQVYSFENSTLENLSSGNDLWFGLIRDCKKPTISCIKTSIHDYLTDTFNYPNDIQFTSFIKFSKNAINYQKSNDTINSVEEIDDNETPLEEIARSLSENTKKFLFTHDLEVKLPDTFFLGSTLKVSPRNFDGNGTMIKLELIPGELNELVPRELKDSESVGQGRIFFKKIRKFISDRLLYALLAVLLVIKLLAVKVLFILPSLVGVVTAKKLIVKVLLFLFPALHHLFKFCAYTPYGAKHHIHKHQIAHIHQVAPTHGHGHHHHDHYDEKYHFAHKQDHGQKYDDLHGSQSEGNEVYNDPSNEVDDDDPWGLGLGPTKPKDDTKRPMTPTEIENMILKAEKEALIKSRLQREKQRIHEENLKLQEQLNNALKIQQKLKHHTAYVNHKKKPGKHQIYHHHPHPHSPLKPPPPSLHSQLLPLLPPPPPGNTYGGGSQFGEQHMQFGDGNYENHGNPGQFVDENGPYGNGPGPFAEPPLNYVENTGYSAEVPPGKIGEGLPGDTVDAVQSFLKTKNNQITPVYPVYTQTPQKTPPKVYYVTPTQHTDNFVTPQHVTVESVQSGISHLPTNSQSGSKEVANRKSDISTQEEQFYIAAAITYDPFYSPILEKIDAVLNELNFVKEPCRERLICSMYKNPERFSPHSNLVSAELSRDPKDLKKPTVTNAAVIRFYKYVQAARDGQDQRDCIRLYPSCEINTEDLS